MATNDTRSRNRRERKTEKHVRDVNYQGWEPTGQGAVYGPNVGVEMGSPKKINGKKYTRKSKDGNVRYRITGFRSVNPFPDGPSERFKQNEVLYDYATKVNKTKKEAYTTTSYKAKDKNRKDDNADKKNKTKIKKKGKSALLIKKADKSDKSAGRLKGDKGNKKKQKTGTQGGGRSGLNIPRS